MFSAGTCAIVGTGEREVLRCVAIGCSNREIATQLVITPATVKKHLEHIYTKLDVHSRAAAVAFAYREGLVADASADASADGPAVPVGATKA